MRIGIVTFHQALNYGAILQTYALQAYINTSYGGAEAEVVDYRCPRLTAFYSLCRNRGGNPVKNAVKAAHFLFKKGRFDRFVHRYIPVSGRVYDANSIDNANREYHKFLVGSDQVWNPNLTDFDMNYLLQFADTDKRFSYAASVGIREIPEKAQQEYKELLNTFPKISVREITAKATLEALGVQSDIQVHMDPTLLLGRHRWFNLCRAVKTRKKGYVLVFTVEYSRELIDEAVTFAQQKGLDVYYIGQYTKRKDIKYIPFISIEKLLALFRDARYVFENSFHGTVLSVIFRRKFYARLPYADGRNSRITDLLKTLKLEGRTNLEDVCKDEDWAKVEEALIAERKAAREYLKWVIEYEN